MTIVILFSMGLIGFAICIWLASEHFRKVVDIEYVEFHQQWINDGRPSGSRLTRKEESFLFSGFSPPILFLQWVILPPIWAKGHSKAQFHLNKMKRWVLYSIPPMDVLCWFLYTCNEGVVMCNRTSRCSGQRLHLTTSCRLQSGLQLCCKRDGFRLSWFSAG